MRLFGSSQDWNGERGSSHVSYREVVRGTHRQSGSKVALKRIIVHNEAEGMPVTALREIKILKRLKHPSVVTLVEMAFKKGTDVLWHSRSDP